MKNCIDMPIFHRTICAENVTNSPYPTRETALQISLAVPRTKTFSEWRILWKFILYRQGIR